MPRMILTRRLKTNTDAERRIFIGGNIIITLLEIDTNKVRLAIDAPPEVTIDREERLTNEQVAAVERATQRRD